jgi:hypothetical protein
LIFLGFPLHAAKKPSRSRADHLRDVALPMLFLSGTRDDLAEISAMRELCGELGARATLHEVEGASHSFELRKSAGVSSAEVHARLASAIAGWIRPFA